MRIWEEHYAFSRDFGQRGTYIEAISAIDIALSKGVAIEDIIRHVELLLAERSTRQAQRPC